MTGSAIVFMPLLGWAKLRLARRLDSEATAGEGIQSLLCAAQATAALIALIGAGAGLQILDPIAALVISAIAVRECVSLWRGTADDCCAPIGFDDRAARQRELLRDRQLHDVEPWHHRHLMLRCRPPAADGDKSGD